MQHGRRWSQLASPIKQIAHSTKSSGPTGKCNGTGLELESLNAGDGDSDGSSSRSESVSSSSSLSGELMIRSAKNVWRDSKLLNIGDGRLVKPNLSAIKVIVISGREINEINFDCELLRRKLLKLTKRGKIATFNRNWTANYGLGLRFDESQFSVTHFNRNQVQIQKLEIESHKSKLSNAICQILNSVSQISIDYRLSLTREKNIDWRVWHSEC